MGYSIVNTRPRSPSGEASSWTVETQARSGADPLDAPSTRTLRVGG